VEEILKEIGLERYLEVFRQNGFDELDTLKDLNESDMATMSIPRGHQGKLLRRAKEIAAIANVDFGPLDLD
jgi:hypothetical protein